MRRLAVLLAGLICATGLLAQAPIVRSIQFVNFKPVSVDDIRQALRENRVQLAVERAFDQQDVDAAKAVLEKLVKEKGLSVRVETRPIPPRSIEVIFTAAAP